MRKIVKSMLLLFTVVALIGIVSATSTINTNFNTTYSTDGTRLDTCDTCHISGQDQSAVTLNSYGKDLQNNSENFVTIESLDSDKDRFTNIEEIDNLTFPGNSNDFPPKIIGFGPSSPVSNTSTPATQTFNVTVNQAVDNLTWKLDDVINKTDHNSAVSSNTITVYATGIYTVTLTAEKTGDGSVEYSWTWNVETTTPPVSGGMFNISGFKINGSDNTGIKNWNITLKNTTMEKTIKTGDNGFYTFTNLVNGTYNVTEETRSDFTPAGPTTKEITISGSNVKDVNFTNSPVSVTPTVTPTGAGSISGHVSDTDNAPLSGITIQLVGMVKDNTDVAIKETTTDSQGLYKFDNLGAGIYIVLVKSTELSGHKLLLVVLSQGENSENNDFKLRSFGEPTVTVTIGPISTITVTPTVITTPTVTVTAEPTITPTVTVTAEPTITPTVTVTAEPMTTNTATLDTNGVYISSVRFNAPGTDTAANINDEWIKITNSGSTSVGMTNWKLLDKENHGNNKLPFQDFTLDSGATVMVHTGNGEPSSTDLYWGYGTHIWNNPENGGDTATLIDDNGDKIDEKTCNENNCEWGQ